MPLLSPSSPSAPSNLKPSHVYKMMLEKMFEAMLCLVPTVDTSSNYQNGMARDTASLSTKKLGSLSNRSSSSVDLMGGTPNLPTLKSASN